MTRTFAEYIEAREANRQSFAQAHADVLQAFEVAVRAFAILGEQLRDGRDKENKTHISLAPFYFILQRQAIAAFDAVSASQAYQAWVALRTGIESALIMGKWVDDKKNADIWERRFENPKPYRATFQGSGLESRSLPDSKLIRLALSHINDDFLHPNPKYYYRHLSTNTLPDGRISLELDFFDKTEDVYAAILSILHLVATVQDRLAQMFAAMFVGVSRIDIGLADLEAKAGDWRRSLGTRDARSEWLLVNVGLWPPAT
jgi:hypothetical protein